MVSLLEYRPSGSRSRDRRGWLPRHALLVMTRCEALGTMYQQRRIPFCCGLAKNPMVNESELVINPVKGWRRNGNDTPCQNGNADSKQYYNLTAFLSEVQPGNSEYLRDSFKVTYMEHSKPDEPHDCSGIPTVRKGDGLAGRGTKKKQMPFCNGMDRGFYNERIICRGGYPTRKGADFKSGRD